MMKQIKDSLGMPGMMDTTTLSAAEVGKLELDFKLKEPKSVSLPPKRGSISLYH